MNKGTLIIFFLFINSIYHDVSAKNKGSDHIFIDSPDTSEAPGSSHIIHKKISFNPAIELRVGRVFMNYHKNTYNGFTISFNKEFVNGYSANLGLIGLIHFKDDFSLKTGITLEFQEFFHKDFDNSTTLIREDFDEYYYTTLPLILSINIPGKKTIYSPEIGLVTDFILSSVYKVKELPNSGKASIFIKSDNTKYEMNYMSLDLGFNFKYKNKRISYKLNCLIDLSKIYLLFENDPIYKNVYGYQPHDYYKKHGIFFSINYNF